uniref:subtilisin n=1 Tax=Globisporangium ultimum (strain ATCC 200006 / CBS 805.95 / DAOM BR144) TaxID=431595 RepID=K3WXZ9_GLOUD
MIVTLREKTKLTKLKDTLQAHAKSSQKEVLGALSKADQGSFSESESFWVTNQVVVRAVSSKLVAKLKTLPSVADMSPERVHAIIASVFQSNDSTAIAVTNNKPTTSPAPTTPVSWGVSTVKAPEIWSTGKTGASIVVETIDTGKAIKPYDSAGHGIHVMGIIAGAYGVEVAPDTQ